MIAACSIEWIVPHTVFQYVGLALRFVVGSTHETAENMMIAVQAARANTLHKDETADLDDKMSKSESVFNRAAASVHLDVTSLLENFLYGVHACTFDHFDGTDINILMYGS